jgi:bifunctional DNA-binding transcriptional regulator/antitoxin component of YhaV-PrlF toxin-antitoxin module
VDTWQPHTINKGSSQVTIPVKLLRAVGLNQGDDVYLGINPDDPRTIVIVPASLMTSWIDKGRRVDTGLSP